MILNIPTKVSFGINCIKAFSIEKAFRKVLIITSKTFENNIYLKETVFKYFEEASIQVQFIIIPSGEPNTNGIDSVYAQMHKDIEAIIAIGGGSILDTAKFLSILFYSSESSMEYDFNKIDIIKALPLYLIPTTAGSGSEVTPYAVAQNSATKRKFTIASELLLPKQSFIDSIFLKKLPRKTLISSALDAFIHSLEVLLNKNENILLEELALSSMSNIVKVLEKNLDKLNDKDYETLAQSSLYGGICIANSRTGMIHTFSVAFSEYSEEAHGILNSKILYQVLTFNLDSFNGKLAKIVSKVFNSKTKTDDEALSIIEKFINSLVPNRSILFNSEPSLDYIANRVLQDKGLFDANLKEYSRDDLIKIAEELVCQD